MRASIKVLQLLPRLGADALEALAALANDHALVRLALDHDAGADAALGAFPPTCR